MTLRTEIVRSELVFFNLTVLLIIVEKLIVGHIEKITADNPADAAVADNQHIFIGMIFLHIFNKTVDPPGHLHHGLTALRVSESKLALVGEKTRVLPVFSLKYTVILLDEPLIHHERNPPAIGHGQMKQILIYGKTYRTNSHLNKERKRPL